MSDARGSSEKRPPLAMVVAIGDNGAIGKDGKVPWRIPEDLKHFKRITMGPTSRGVRSARRDLC